MKISSYLNTTWSSKRSANERGRRQHLKYFAGEIGQVNAKSSFKKYPLMAYFSAYVNIYAISRRHATGLQSYYNLKYRRLRIPHSRNLIFFMLLSSEMIPRHYIFDLATKRADDERYRRALLWSINKFLMAMLFNMYLSFEKCRNNESYVHGKMSIGDAAVINEMAEWAYFHSPCLRILRLREIALRRPNY